MAPKDGRPQVALWVLAWIVVCLTLVKSWTIFETLRTAGFPIEGLLFAGSFLGLVCVIKFSEGYRFGLTILSTLALFSFVISGSAALGHHNAGLVEAVADSKATERAERAHTFTENALASARKTYIARYDACRHEQSGLRKQLDEPYHPLAVQRARIELNDRFQATVERCDATKRQLAVVTQASTGTKFSSADRDLLDAHSLGRISFVNNLVAADPLVISAPLDPGIRFPNPGTPASALSSNTERLSWALLNRGTREAEPLLSELFLNAVLQIFALIAAYLLDQHHRKVIEPRRATIHPFPGRPVAA